ncbi:copper chaperone NosL [Pedobacter sp. UYP24]
MKKLSNLILFFTILMVSLTSCSTGPQKIEIGKDACSFCKMSIVDSHFGAEILTKKGKVYKFDDVHCLLGFIKANTIDNKLTKEIYFVNFDDPHNLIEASKVILLKSNNLHSPMGGNIAGFSDRNKMNETLSKTTGEEINWPELLKKTSE